MKCINCDDELISIMGSQTQFHDALDIQVHLGYAEFADHEPNGEPSPRGYFCKKCANVLCGFFPGFRRLTGVTETPAEKKNVFDQDKEDGDASMN